MSEPNPPSQPKANGPGDSAGSKPVQFNSATSAKANQPKDYFAEQNKQRAEKKQKTKKIRVLAVLISVVVVLALIAVIVILVSRHSGPVVDDAGQDGDTSSELAGVQNLNNQVEEVFDPTFSVGEDGNIVMDGDFEAVEQMYAAALDNPANAGRINTIYLAQMTFYSSFGDTERVVEIAQKVDPAKLNSSERANFYNLAYLAYTALGDTLHAEHYNKLMREASGKIEGIGA